MTNKVNIRELSDTFKIKPEYQGDNHPLRSNQVKRTARNVKPSARALDALHQFNTLGKASLPKPQALIEFEELNRRYPYCRWDKHRDNCECDNFPGCPREPRPRHKLPHMPAAEIFEEVARPHNKYLVVENDPGSTPKEKSIAFRKFMEGEFS